MRTAFLSSRTTISCLSAALLVASSVAQGDDDLQEGLRLLRSPAWEERVAGARMLGRLTPRRQEALPELVKAMGDQATLVRASVAEALSGFGEAAVPALLKGLNDPSDKVRKTSAFALGDMGRAAEAAVPQMGRMLRKDGDRYVRWSAAHALGSLGQVARKAVPDLAAVLDDADHWLRVVAAEALWKVDKHPAAVPALVKVYESAGRNDRIDAVYTLRRLGADARAAVPALVRGLKDEDDTLACRTAETLGAIGPAAKDAIPALVRMMRDTKRPGCCDSAAFGLRDIGEASVPVWVEALRDKDPYLRKHAAMYLGRYGKAAWVAKESLLAALGDAEAEVRWLAACSLGELSLPAGQVTPGLERLLKDSELRVRLEAGLALWRVSGNMKGFPHLLAGLRSDDYHLRERAAEMCEEMGPAARPALADLTNLLKDSEKFVREAAAKALQKVDPSSQRPKP
jgi:HEAT repeat protein